MKYFKKQYISLSQINVVSLKDCSKEELLDKQQKLQDILKSVAQDKTHVKFSNIAKQIEEIETQRVNYKGIDLNFREIFHYYDGIFTNYIKDTHEEYKKLIKKNNKNLYKYASKIKDETSAYADILFAINHILLEINTILEDKNAQKESDNLQAEFGRNSFNEQFYSNERRLKDARDEYDNLYLVLAKAGEYEKVLAVYPEIKELLDSKTITQFDKCNDTMQANGIVEQASKLSSKIIDLLNIKCQILRLEKDINNQLSAMATPIVNINGIQIGELKVEDVKNCSEAQEEME